MSTHSRTDSRGRSVRFTDAPHQRAVPANQPRPQQQFDTVQWEHNVFIQDPPARGHWVDQPPSPQLRTHPLLDMPDPGELRLSEGSSPNHTLTAANSPEIHTAPLSTHSPNPEPDITPSPSPPSSPEHQSELAPHLAGPCLQWDVRRVELCPSLCARDPTLDDPAFTFKEEEESYTLLFVVDDTNSWTTDIPPRLDASQLTVWDVLTAIKRSLYQHMDETALLPTDAHYAAALQERPCRLRGKEDMKGNVFRNIDFFPEASQSYFHGLVKKRYVEKEVTQFEVLLDTRPPRVP